jgi:hypothetical protein
MGRGEPTVVHTECTHESSNRCPIAAGATAGKFAGGIPRGHSPRPRGEVHRAILIRDSPMPPMGNSPRLPGGIHRVFSTQSSCLTGKFTVRRREIHREAQGNSPQGWVNPNGGSGLLVAQDRIPIINYTEVLLTFQLATYRCILTITASILIITARKAIRGMNKWSWDSKKSGNRGWE